MSFYELPDVLRLLGFKRAAAALGVAVAVAIGFVPPVQAHFVAGLQASAEEAGDRAQRLFNDWVESSGIGVPATCAAQDRAACAPATSSPSTTMPA